METGEPTGYWTGSKSEGNRTWIPMPIPDDFAPYLESWQREGAWFQWWTIARDPSTFVLPDGQRSEFQAQQQSASDGGTARRKWSRVGRGLLTGLAVVSEDLERSSRRKDAERARHVAENVLAERHEQLLQAINHSPPDYSGPTRM
jgi:hypothetical protein